MGIFVQTSGTVQNLRFSDAKGYPRKALTLALTPRPLRAMQLALFFRYS